MLEPYAAKVARTVLRRGGASNRVFLVYLRHQKWLYTMIYHITLSTNVEEDWNTRNDDRFQSCAPMMPICHIWRRRNKYGG